MKVYDILCPNCGAPARRNETCEYCDHVHENDTTDPEETLDAPPCDPDEADDDYDPDATALDERDG